MGDLLDLVFYNPSQLPEDDFVRGFVARQELLRKLLERLGEVHARGAVQHRLILGQRGMGKTSLLRRIAIGVRDSAQLAQILLPLSFREEQYNVHNLHIFWCNCLDALGDWFESQGQTERAGQLDREVEALARRDDDSEGSAAHDLFKRWMQTTGRRPLLLLDNIDLILDGLKPQEWGLRRALQEADGVVIIGASSNYLESTAKPDEAFYDFFQVDLLKRLEPDELSTCLRSLARERAEAGKPVTRILDREPGRVRAMHDLTGGNPRTLAMLYLVLEAGDDGDLMRDLERLLDQATPLYKARVEELALQARVVFDAVALAWNPISAAQLAKATQLDIGHVSAQLDRLQKEGIVEKVSLSTTARSGYQIGERFFNIWYLMRHAPRRQRNRLRWLTEFLRALYTPPQLDELAAGVFSRTGRDSLSRGSYCLALSDAVHNQTLRSMLRDEARAELERYAVETGVSLESLMDATEPLERGTAWDWYRRGLALIGTSQWPAVEAAYRKAIELDPNLAHPWAGLGTLLADIMGRFEEAEAAYRRAIEIDPKYCFAWTSLGKLMSLHLARFDESEAAFRKAIEFDSKTAAGWNGLGCLLQDHLERRGEAEFAYRKVCEIDPANTVARVNLAYLMLASDPGGEETNLAFERAGRLLTPDGASLLQAFRALAQGGFDAAVTQLRAPLEHGNPRLFAMHFDALLRVFRLAAERGFGDRLLEWLDESGFGERYWPLRAAYDAYLHGERALLDVNPEVRGAARRIYDWLDSSRVRQTANAVVGVSDSGRANRRKPARRTKS